MTYSTVDGKMKKSNGNRHKNGLSNTVNNIATKQMRTIEG